MRSTSSASDSGRTSTRRQLLRWGSIAGISWLAGCTEDVGREFPPNEKWPVSELKPKLPVRERADLMADHISTMAESEIEDVEAFAGAFDEYALQVESVERERDVLTIEYVNTELSLRGNLHDVAPIAGGYAALVDSGYDAVALGITILDDAPASYGTAAVETDWAKRYNAGTLTAEEYGELVATTIESKRRPPDVDVSPDE